MVSAYRGSACNVDVGFWNVEWFNRHYREKLRDVAGIVADLNLDIWAFEEASPKAVEALVRWMEEEFGQTYDYAASEPDASSSKQTTAVMWNTKTVRGERLDWPSEIDRWLRVDSRDVDELQLEAVEGRVFNRYPGLFHFDSISRRDSKLAPFDFNLVPVHLKAKDEGKKRRRLASKLLAAAVRKMIDERGADHDWIIGGDFNAELASKDFDLLSGTGFKALSAEDEEDGALTYLKGPRSLIDHIFLSPNMAQSYGADDFLIYAQDKTRPDYVRQISDHRPVLVRLNPRDHPSQETITADALGGELHDFLGTRDREEYLATSPVASDEIIDDTLRVLKANPAAVGNHCDPTQLRIF